jgi:hypothetical protein
MSIQRRARSPQWWREGKLPFDRFVSSLLPFDLMSPVLEFDSACTTFLILLIPVYIICTWMILQQHLTTWFQTNPAHWVHNSVHLISLIKGLSQERLMYNSTRLATINCSMDPTISSIYTQCLCFLYQQITGYARSRVSVLSWSYEQEHKLYILVQTPLDKVRALRPVVYY